MHTIESIQNTISDTPALMLYFTASGCGVCQALKPKLFYAISAHFDPFETETIDIAEKPEIAAHFGVFTIPTVLIFLGGKEFLRKSRHMSVDEIIEQIERPHRLMHISST